VVMGSWTISPPHKPEPQGLTHTFAVGLPPLMQAVFIPGSNLTML